MQQDPAQTSGFTVVKSNPRDLLSQAKNVWLDLQQRAPHSFFNSWGWMECWLQCLPPRLPVWLVVKQSVQGPVACWFLGIRSGVERKLVFKRRAFLNATGHEVYDDLTIEYNAPLCLADENPLGELLSQAPFQPVEELRISLMPEAAYRRLQVPQGWAVSQVTPVASHYVDLMAIRAQGQSYLDVLSRNRRGQIRQSMKLYTDSGSLRLEEAATTGQALDMLTELAQIHQRDWQQRGKEGAFHSGFSRDFHRRLVESRFEHGEIQLLKISNSQGPLGYLYNFVYGNQVLFYQSGLFFQSDNRFRPGMVCHAMAIEHNLAQNRQNYNFLAGEGRYKVGLSTSRDMLYSVVIARDNLKWRLENWLAGHFGRTSR